MPENYSRAIERPRAADVGTIQTRSRSSWHAKGACWRRVANSKTAGRLSSGYARSPSEVRTNSRDETMLALLSFPVELLGDAVVFVAVMAGMLAAAPE